MFFASVRAWSLSFSLVFATCAGAGDEQEKSDSKSQPTLRSAFSGREPELKKVEETFGDPPGKRLVRDGRIWVDPKKKRVIVDGFVALRNGQLEMFACPVGTKEHESIVALFCKSQEVHTALLAAGAKDGDPTQFEPYKPATGSTIRIKALWFDTNGDKKVIRAQDWVRHVPTNSEMKFDWVFAGSGVYRDEDSGQTYYLADGGDLICVANFTSATLDLAVRSQDTNSGLVFSTFPDRIPKEGTPVRLVLEVSEDPPATAEGEAKNEKIELKDYEEVFGKAPEKKQAAAADPKASEDANPESGKKPSDNKKSDKVKSNEKSTTEKSGQPKDGSGTKSKDSGKGGGK